MTLPFIANDFVHMDFIGLEWVFWQLVATASQPKLVLGDLGLRAWHDSSRFITSKLNLGAELSR
jgi:hypothetical protein